MRVGMGYDVHKLVKDRKLIMGGVEIPYELGLLGHFMPLWMHYWVQLHLEI